MNKSFHIKWIEKKGSNLKKKTIEGLSWDFDRPDMKFEVKREERQRKKKYKKAANTKLDIFRQHVPSHNKESTVITMPS